MTKSLIVVDYENVQAIDAKDVPESADILFVCGAKQKTLPTDLFLMQQALRERFRIVAIRDVQANAVDFCVAFYVGEELARTPDLECIILSKDKKGFDPLVTHLVKERGLRVRRLDHLPGTKCVPATAAPSATERALTLFAREKSRPKSLVALRRKIKSYFPASSDADRAAVVSDLLARKVFMESGTGLIYQPSAAG